MKTKPRDKDEHYDRRKKKADEAFCYSCGSIIKKSSSICPKCGISTFGKVEKKEKSTAILLALFTSFFTWLYLYEKNSIKFWIGLLVTLFSVIIAKVLFDSSNSNWTLLTTPIIIVWLFAIIDVSIKNSNYYNSFGG